MKNTFSLEQINGTGNLHANLTLRQHKLNLLAHFLEIKSINPKLKRKEKAKEFVHSSSNLQRFRNDIKIQSPHESNNHKRP